MESRLRLAAPLTFDSIVDGEGLRVVLWTQGCPHRCVGCQNPQTHDPALGFSIAAWELFEQIKKNPLQDGITLSGGEPFDQAASLIALAQACRELGLNVWAYTGYTMETLLQNEAQAKLLQHIDVLVDGRFEHTLKHFDLYFKGSSNQRVIDVAKTLENQEIILWETTAE
ncbi:MAG: anaerobic ribonucleoside-triphosphate reductase activating protein [Erysipelotrichaceae bacterium]